MPQNLKRDKTTLILISLVILLLIPSLVLSFSFSSFSKDVILNKLSSELNFIKDTLANVSKYLLALISQEGGGASSTADISQGLIGHWTFDEGSGTTAGDSSGNNHHGTLMNGPDWAAGVFDGALRFDGVDDYVDIPIDLGSTVTISMWAKSTSIPNASDSDLLWCIDNHSKGPFLLFSSWYFVIALNNRYNNIFSQITPDLHRWHLYTTVLENGNTKLYIDGVLSGRAGYRDPTGAKLNISYPGTVYGWEGTIDDVRVYNRALTEEEIITLASLKPVPLSAATSVKVVSDNWPDASSMRQFSLDVIRLMEAQTNKEKALALFRFIKMFTVQTDGSAPTEQALRKSYINEDLKVLNVYGAHWCEGQSVLMYNAWRAIGGRGDKFEKVSHTMSDIYWEDTDGVSRWHLFDMSHGSYAYDRSGQHIATALDEIGIDYSIIYRPEKGHIPSSLSYWYILAGHHWHHVDSSNHPMDINLRRGEKFTRYSYGEYPPYQYNHRGKGSVNFVHGPYPVSYGSGLLEYSPDFTKKAYENGLFEPPENLASKEEHLGSPNLRPKLAGIPGTAIFEVTSPYIIADAWISGRFYRANTADEIKISISTDAGKTWRELWNAGAATGEISVDNFNIAEKFDIYGTYPDGLISPFGRYDYLLKIEINAQNSVADAGINELAINTVTQHNIYSLPLLWPGRNNVTVGTKSQVDTALKVTYTWDDLLGTERKNIAIVENSPYTYEIVTSGDKWEDVLMKSITIEAIPITGLGNHIEIKEELPAIIIDLGPKDAFPTDNIPGIYDPPPLKTVEQYIADLQDLTNASKIREALAGLVILKDKSSLEAIKRVAWELTSLAEEKGFAMQALYHIGGQDSFPYLMQILDKDPEIKWKYDPDNPYVELGHWWAACMVVANLFADAKYKYDIPDEVVPKLAQIVDSMAGLGKTGADALIGLMNGLKKLDDPRAIPSVRNILTVGTTGDALIATVLTAGELGDTEAIARIREIFLGAMGGSINATQKLCGAEALSKLGDTTITPQLYEMLQRSDENERGYAAEAIGRLAGLLSDTEKDTAIIGLEKLLASETFPWVTEAAEDALNKLRGTTLPGDLNGDNRVDIFDLYIVAQAFGSGPGDTNWDSRADLKNDSYIDIFDLFIVASNFGKGVE